VLFLDSLLMAIGDDDPQNDRARLRVPLAGSLAETGDPFEPYRLVDGGGQPLVPVTEFLRTLQAAGRSEATQRSCSLDLLRWFRFTWAAGFEWEQATRAEARDFCRWLQLAGRPERDHWRTGRPAGPGSGPAPGTVNAVTGKASPGPGYAAATVAHCETVCRSFYDYHLEAGTGPLANPFPLARKGRRAHAHHNPREPFRQERAGLFRPRQLKRIPRGIPDRMFDELFASLPSHRDRALVAFWVSTGARASELLGVTGGSVDPGSQLVTVIRKGVAGDAAAAGVAGRVRVAAALPGGDARPGAVRAGRPGVVDAAAPVPAAVVSRGPRDVQAGGRVAGSELVAARPAPYRCLPVHATRRCRSPTLS